MDLDPHEEEHYYENINISKGKEREFNGNGHSMENDEPGYLVKLVSENSI